ncbi:beta-chimaerin-like [Xenia sp. Carnegie-2017]|uniref:beta-chimaerin-like n=1 Tax=Xenia sp. Carnegie-2017 TaxID=2897299 RepID=UPI001F043754|nr:beta-chimaerin-like [Xenia sp. Carnegie-2017]
MKDEKENESDGALYHEVQPPMWKSYLYELQLRAPKPTRVRCERQIPDKPAYYGKEFHGLISREEADALVSIKSGNYLVRERQKNPGSYALSMRIGKQTMNFRLYYDGMHYVAEKRFETVNDLVADGLITLYIEMNAKDYIDTMMMNPPPLPPVRSQSSRIETSVESTKPVDPNNSRRPSVDYRQSIKTASGYTKDHNFKVHTYKGFYWCDYCKNFLWGLKQQGYKCQDCGYNAHKQCAERLKNAGNCQPHKKLVKRVFGVDLTTLVKAHNTKLPTIVEDCVREVEQRGLKSEGIYRVSGFADDIEVLKNLYDKGDVIDTGPKKFEDINIIAGALKLYLRMLPLPVITFETYGKFLDAIKLEDNERIEAVGRALGELPHAHYALLKFLISHLTMVTTFSKNNMMNSENLSIVFGPTLMRCPENLNLLESQSYIKLQKHVVQCLIDEHDILFGV